MNKNRIIFKISIDTNVRKSNEMFFKPGNRSLYERMSSSSSDEEHSDQTQRLVPGTTT